MFFSTSGDSVKGTEQIYLTTNGVHTDFIVPTRYLSEVQLSNLKADQKTKFVAFGWGDKGFYLDTPEWKDLKLSTAIKAVLLPSETAMHITKFQSTSSKWKAILLSKEQVRKLMSYIEKSFQKKTDKYVLIKEKVYSNSDAFYEAKGSYSFFKSCNEWVNIGLKEIGRKTSLWSPLDWGIFYHLEQEEL